MLVLLDSTTNYIERAIDSYGDHFGQLRTPLTARSIQGYQYALDNGCFSAFNRPTWERQLNEARSYSPIFVALPDVVGSARRTAEMFGRHLGITEGLPRALVTQDGIADLPVPWDDIDAVFIGGSDRHKDGPEAMAVAKAAKILGKWVHVGRVNNAARAKLWKGVADSIDGSGISRYDRMLDQVMREILGTESQLDMCFAEGNQ